MEIIIEKALVLNPDNPFATNFLAYSWVDQGRRLDQALDMLLLAAEQQPGQASITDSVGWAYFKLGQYDRRAITLNARGCSKAIAGRLPIT